jgi:hypothetical protein
MQGAAAIGVWRSRSVTRITREAVAGKQNPGFMMYTHGSRCACVMPRTLRPPQQDGRTPVGPFARPPGQNTKRSR